MLVTFECSESPSQLCFSSPRDFWVVQIKNKQVMDYMKNWGSKIVRMGHISFPYCNAFYWNFKRVESFFHQNTFFFLGFSFFSNQQYIMVSPKIIGFWPKNKENELFVKRIMLRITVNLKLICFVFGTLQTIKQNEDKRKAFDGKIIIYWYLRIYN